MAARGRRGLLFLDERGRERETSSGAESRRTGEMDTPARREGKGGGFFINFK